ncbi:hypothetical protein [Demequina sp. NBRC 110057]|uniref:hypothetical protein n=1 Tax=Demequina sp. NBRC 110057 TaxID=1570346 RepID=UPI0009FDC1FC|nr:hypothetical protein [Demequina sp. NBRC 110057]
MTVTDETVLLADLRLRRREMRRELARVRWWRRLVVARRDLEVAQLTDGEELGRLGLPDAWEALAADAPTASELSGAVWPESAESSPTSVEALAALDARLESYETRVAENLESVTAQMVRALGQAHRGQV